MYNYSSDKKNKDISEKDSKTYFKSMMTQFK